MKKRMLSLILSVVMVLAVLPVSAGAEEGKVYGTVPIYIGYLDVDYMADQLLAEIAPQGTPREKILTVYNWIIQNCDREGAMDKTYFDMDAVYAAIDNGYGDQAVQAEMDGEIVLRIDIASQLNTDPYELPYDSNDYITYFGQSMMLYRVGNCAHYAALLNLLLCHMGYDCRLIDGDFINSDGSRTEHKWNMVLLDGKYYWLDVRMDHAGYVRTGKLNHSYFLVEDTAQWEKKHQWDRAYSDAVMESAPLLVEAYGLLAQIPDMVEDLFDDLAPWAACSDWAKPYLESAVELDIYPDSLLQTDMTQPVSREEFASVAVRYYKALSGKELALPEGYANPFRDVRADQSDILLAEANGIVNGTSADTFSPAAPLTRAQAVTMLGRVAELVQTGAIDNGAALPLGDTVLTFTDSARIDAWAAHYVNFFVSNGAINGVGDGSFSPAGTMTREAALKVAVVSLED